MMKRVQKENILKLNAKYTAIIDTGMANIIAMPLMPEFLNEYKLSKNRRKSIITLPPFSCTYSDILFE